MSLTAILALVVAAIGAIGGAFAFGPFQRRKGRKDAERDHKQQEVRDELDARKNSDAAQDAARADPGGAADRLRDTAANGFGRGRL